MNDSSVSYDVRIWSLAKYKGKRGTTYTVRWVIAGQKQQQTFTNSKLAETFRSQLLIAARQGESFSRSGGLPASMRDDQTRKTWYELACDFVDSKWAHASPRHRKSIAEALTTVTISLVNNSESMPPPRDVRAALFRWSFNAIARKSQPPVEYDDALRWIESVSVPLASVREAKQLRRALDALAVTLDGRTAAASTVMRKRSAFYSALEYAVEAELLEVNPLARIKWRAPVTTDSVDRRTVVNPTQARALLAAVHQISPGTEGFFACIYYAGLRPSEARSLRLRDCTLPESGWGELLLTSSHQPSGAAWTDSGLADEERQLKHRSLKDTRRIPAAPELVHTLRAHIEQFELGIDGHLFVARTGRRGVPLAGPYGNPLSMTTAYRVWHLARKNALTKAQVNSPLARRPYDLRHACLSTWLNAGVPATQVAEWAGHSVNVLLRVYAKCLEGQDKVAKSQIERALNEPGT